MKSMKLTVIKGKTEESNKDLIIANFANKEKVVNIIIKSTQFQIEKENKIASDRSRVTV